MRSPTPSSLREPGADPPWQTGFNRVASSNRLNEHLPQALRTTARSGVDVDQPRAVFPQLASDEVVARSSAGGLDAAVIKIATGQAASR